MCCSDSVLFSNICCRCEGVRVSHTSTYERVQVSVKYINKVIPYTILQVDHLASCTLVKCAQYISSCTNQINFSSSLKQTFRPLYSGPHPRNTSNADSTSKYSNGRGGVKRSGKRVVNNF